jgi:hypothetical protein
MNEKRVIKEWTAKAPAWDQIIEHYRARPGLVEWLSNRMPVMRGEIEDSPAPEIIIHREAAE